MNIETDFMNYTVKVDGLEIVDIEFNIQQVGDKFRSDVYYRGNKIGSARLQRHQYKVCDKTADIIGHYLRYENPSALPFFKNPTQIVVNDVVVGTYTKTSI